MILPGFNSSIAIVGMAGRYALCNDLDKLWNAVVHGWIFPQRARLSQRCLPRHSSASPPGQSAPPEFAAHTLQVAIEALVHWHRGCFDPDLRMSLWLAQDLTKTRQGYDGESVSAKSLAAWLGRQLNWSGLALDIDTACSSAFTAIHAASMALQSHACDVALVGAVNGGLERALMDGCLRRRRLGPPGNIVDVDNIGARLGAEAAGALVLRRADDATAQGDATYGFIRAVECGLLGPSTALAGDLDRRLSVLARTCMTAGIRGADIDHFELQEFGMHGFRGAVELAVISEFLCGSGAHPSLGVVWTTVGHVHVAIGMAMLQKCILALFHERRPPIAPIRPFETTFAQSHSDFLLPDASTLWLRRESPRWVCLTSAGATGGVSCILLSDRI